MDGSWWRSRRLRGWALLGGAVTSGVTVGAVATQWLSGPAAAAVGSTLAAAVFGVASARAKVVLDRDADDKAALPAKLVGTSESGRLRRVREFDDPIALRVHPAETLSRAVDRRSVADQVPPYVPRDAQQQLWDATASGGFVLLTGESTAGKSRMAYEAIRALLPDHVLVAPANREALTDLVNVVLEQRRCVVWLDDLERFLGPSGLTAATVVRMLGDGSRSTLLLATVRTAEFDRFSAREEPRFIGLERDTWRDARDVLALATTVELPRAWSSQERLRARDYADDPRIAAALDKTDQFGLAELLAAGPQLSRDWRNAWRLGAHPRGAALVAAAVDCRRAGMHEPQPLDVLSELAEHYLRERGGPILRPESLEDAVTWATTPSQGASSLLLPAKQDSHYLAFDYLIDLDGLHGVPQAIWDTLIQGATPQQAFDIGEAAAQRYQHATAVVAFRKAAESQVPDADVAMANALGGSLNRTAAMQTVTELLEQRQRSVGADDLSTLRIRLLLAQFTAWGDNRADARSMCAELIVDLERVLGPDHAQTLRARFWMAWALGETDDFNNAFREYSQIALDQCRVLGPHHPDTLETRHCHIFHLAASGEFRRSVELGNKLIDDRTRALGADHPQTFQTRSLVAVTTAWMGDSARAEKLCSELAGDRQRVLGERHLHTFFTRYDQARCAALTGDLDRATEEFTTFLADWRQAYWNNSSWSDTARAFLESVNDGRSLGPPYTAYARRTLPEAWKTCRQLLGTEHPLTQEIRRQLAPLLPEAAH
ncbi:hypothetical protein [Amycolatopsis sp. NBC_00438]|uniref:hypothetical protein n=1 Tax=Amycolatopsis sp. NBC_00438 TaxID=2903558 RepID=UPI002E2400BA